MKPEDLINRISKARCKHTNTETHNHGRKTHPFGQRSKARYIGTKYITVHCKTCGKVVHDSRKTR